MNRQLLDGVAQNVETPAENALDRGEGVSSAFAGPMRTWASPVLAATGVVCWDASIGRIHPYSTGIIGLVSKLPVLWWLGLALVLVAVALELARDTPRLPAMVVTVVSLALVLHGTLPASETTPRLDAAYDVAGFAQYIGQHGRTLPYLDARMSWPGMLSGAGMLAQAMHVPTLWFARWAPLFLNLAYLLPVKAIANVSLRTSRARWAALPIFLASNWIDQDYFSPQAIDLLLFLTIVAIAIRTFAARGEQPKVVRSLMTTPPYRVMRSMLPRLVRLPSDAVPGELMVDDTTTIRRAASFGLVLVAHCRGGRVPPVHSFGVVPGIGGSLRRGPHPPQVAVACSASSWSSPGCRGRRRSTGPVISTSSSVEWATSAHCWDRASPPVWPTSRPPGSRSSGLDWPPRSSPGSGASWVSGCCGDAVGRNGRSPSCSCFR